MNRVLRSALTLLAAASLAACFGDDDDNDGDRREVELTIAHVNDHHSQLEPFAGTELLLGGVPTQVELGGFARLTTLFKQAEADHPNLLKLHAGDAITGSLYYTFFKGEADARMMNTVCFDAFELGNHEFDDGDAALAGFIDDLHAGECRTPVLAANVHPQVGTPLAPRAADDYLKPYTIKEIDGVRIGIVGIDIRGKTQNSSRPLATTEFEDEATAAQRTIDTLRNDEGVRRIVLLTHQGYDNDVALAARLTDVDVIVGGDSHTLLGDFTTEGISSAGAYPTRVQNQDGDTVCIVQAWEYAKAFGLLTVRFDRDGRVAQCDGQASLVIGDRFQRQATADAEWTDLPDAERTALLTALAAQPGVKVVTPDAGAAGILAGYSEQVEAQRAIEIGTADEALCLVRQPGEATNRSAGVAGCETANTLARGSDAAQSVAEAFLFASRNADFSLQNAGGVRVPIAAGELTMNTAFTVLPFTNVLVELDITGAEVLAALEDAVSNHLDAAQSNGSHPYAAGLRWDLDMSQAKGTRFTNVQVRDRSTGAWSPLDANARYVMVTNDFIGAGQDGYATLKTVTDDGRSTNTYLLYTQTFADWVQAEGTIGRPARADYSHQRVVAADGTVLP